MFSFHSVPRPIVIFQGALLCVFLSMSHSIFKLSCDATVVPQGATVHSLETVILMGHLYLQWPIYSALLGVVVVFASLLEGEALKRF